MAYRESIVSADIRQNLSEHFFWNLHDNVGYGCKNNRSDVMLVQFFINSAFKDWKGPSKLLKVDGYFGGKTWRAIKIFQKLSYGPEDNEGNWLTIPMATDGSVNTIKGTRMISTRSKTLYTILAMNFAYDWDVQKGIYFSDIRKDPDIPELLKSQLTGVPTVV